MVLRVSLALCVLMVAQCSDVMGREFISSPTIDNWLRFLVPFPECAGQKSGTQVEDPENCYNFYVCSGDGQRVPGESMPCGVPFIDCYYLGECTYHDDTTACDKYCANNVIKTCKTECGIPGDLVYNKEDCFKFGVCAENGFILPQDCEKYDGDYFNGNNCGTDQSACCTCGIEECTDVGYNITDPENCKQFYTCTQIGGKPTAVGPTPCDEDQFFDAEIGHCIPEETECKNACPAGGGGSTTPATTTTTDPGCGNPDDFPCPKQGDYAYCTYCDRHYIECDASNTPYLRDCGEGQLFNTNPAIPKCLTPEEPCPWYP